MTNHQLTDDLSTQAYSGPYADYHRLTDRDADGRAYAAPFRRRRRAVVAVPA